MNIMMQGSLPSIVDLPLTGFNEGDAYIAGGHLYIAMGGVWISHGQLSTPRHKVILAYRGVCVELECREDLSALFENTALLTDDDMALFSLTYPSEFETFEDLWKTAWIEKRVTREFNIWRKDEKVK